MQLIADGRNKMEKGVVRVQKQANKEFEAEKRWWSWEKGYEREQGIRMSQDYGRFRNGKGRLKHK